jgi:hypothetical protein
VPTTKPVYSLNKPSALNVCNYNKFLKSLSNKDIDNIMKTGCICESSNNIINPYHGHIITGNIENIVNNTNLAKYLKSGSKFRSMLYTSVQEKVKIISDVVSNHKSKLLKRIKILPNNSIDSFLQDEINKLVSRWDSKENREISCKSDFDHYVKTVQEKYIITIVD